MPPLLEVLKAANPKDAGALVALARIEAEYKHNDAAIKLASEAISLHRSSLASRYVPIAARKKAIDAEKPKLAATGSSNASSVNGLNGAGCVSPARTSPHPWKRFHNGHSPFAIDCRSASRHGIIWKVMSESIRFCGSGAPTSAVYAFNGSVVYASSTGA